MIDLTLGEKIKYLRKQLGLTQDQLAQMTGIHPVSIRKYETDKTKPQPAQIERLAHALGVGSFALSGINKDDAPIETVGDLLGLIITLCDTGILQITGTRGTDNMIIPETVQIQFNPNLSPYLKTCGLIVSSQDINDGHSNAMPPDILHNLLAWEKMNFLYKSSLASAKDDLNQSTRILLSSFEEMKSRFELEVQKSQILLNLKK